MVLSILYGYSLYVFYTVCGVCSCMGGMLFRLSYDGWGVIKKGNISLMRPFCTYLPPEQTKIYLVFTIKVCSCVREQGPLTLHRGYLYVTSGIKDLLTVTAIVFVCRILVYTFGVFYFTDLE